MDRSPEFNPIYDYLIQLIGKPYKFWSGQDIRRDGEPFWVGRTVVEAKEVSSVSCTGLLNLVCRYLGKKIPDIDNDECYFPGSTRSWLAFLCAKYGYQLYNPSAIYPRGTLLVRSYHQYNDQGHVAIIINTNQETIHSRPNDMVIRQGFIEPGVVIESPKFMDSFTIGCYYEYYYVFEQWTEL